MSDINLLVFGCAVSFIAVAGAIVYIAESRTPVRSRESSTPRNTGVSEAKLREVA